MNPFTKDSFELVEQRLGRVPAHGLLVLACVAGAVLLLGIIAGAIKVTYTSIVEPALRMLPTMDINAYSNALIAILVTILLLLIIGAVVLRYFRRWERVLYDTIAAAIVRAVASGSLWCRTLELQP